MTVDDSAGICLPSRSPFELNGSAKLSPPASESCLSVGLLWKADTSIYEIYWLR